MRLRAGKATRVPAIVAALAVPISGVGIGVASVAATAVATAARCAAASYSSHVTLVVEHADSSVIGLCIGFDGGSITGEQILQASGLHYATQSYGSLGDAVCQIDGEPASYGSCLPASGSYWAMFVSRGGGGWQVADHGISSETFADGDAEGFRYDAQNGAEPAPASPGGICARALAGGGSSGSGPPPGQDVAGAAPAGSPAGSGVNGGSSGASSDATGAASGTGPPPNSATALAGTPAPAVIGPASPRAGGIASTAASRMPPAGVNPGLLMAAVVGGALLGLIAVQVVRRRRA